MKSFLTTVWDLVLKNGVDWIITAVVTFFSVRIATNRYYNATKKQVTKGFMEQGLRELLNLGNNDALPLDAQVILVKYSGRCYRVKNDNKCTFFEKIRKTINSVGGNPMTVSTYRPRNYGVLGVANILKTPVLFDFQNGELYLYERGKIIKNKNIVFEDGKYYYNTETETVFLSNKETTRDVMIAIPLIIEKSKKIVGGVTFDLTIGAKTIYQKILEDDDNEIKKTKTDNNIKVFNDALRTSNNIINAYFKKKGDDFQ